MRFSNSSSPGLRRLKLQVFAICAGLLALIIGGTGCGKSDSTRIVRLMMWDIAGTEKAISLASRAFEKHHKGYVVRVEKTPMRGYEEKLIVLMGAEDAPDVAVLPDFRYAEYVRQRALSDLSRRLPKSRVSALVPAKDLSALSIRGEVRGIPTGLRGILWVVPTSCRHKSLAWDLVERLVEAGYIPFQRLKVSDMIRVI